VEKWVNNVAKYVLRNTMLDLLLRIEQGSGYSHLLIDHEIKKKQLSEKDKGLLTEVVYGTIQRKLTLDYYLNNFIKTNKKQKPWVQMLLRMSIYQMVFLDKVPAHAVIHEAVEITKQRGHKGVASFVNGVLRNVQRQGVPETSSIKDPIKRLSIETSHPEWMIKKWIEDYGLKTTKDMCRENMERKQVSVRIQPLKISREAAVKQLNVEGFDVEPSSISKQGLIIKKGNIVNSRLFQEGYLTIQDQSSMLVGEMLDARPGMSVLDACSAPGGKTTHLAEKMENKGVVKAHDLHKKKINLVNEKSSQLSLSIIDASQADARVLNTVYDQESFDRILIDAPCSGLGVLKGKPDIKFTKQADDIYQLAKIQLDILKSVAPLLKIGGLLIYSTCTVNHEENESVIQSFLKQHPNYEVDKAFFDTLPDNLKNSLGETENGLQLFPQTLQTDGFFLTRLRKTF